MVGTRRLIELEDRASQGLRLPEGPLVLGLSGGADSTALLWLVSGMGREVRALHVDHRLVGSPVMREAAIAVAGMVGTPLEVVSTTVGPGASPEAVAREARYQAISASVGPGESVLTAHTSEDNAETVLINLIRGTGTKGLAGIPAFRDPNIHRPALGLSRDVLREIAVLAGLPFVDDPMNSDPGLTRNRIRTTVMPLLRDLNPSIAESVRRMTEVVRADVAILDSLSRLRVTFSDRLALVPVGVLRSRPRPLVDRALLDLLGAVGGRQPEASHLDRLWDVIDGSSASQEIKGGMVARIEGPFLVIGPQPGPGDRELVLTPGLHRHENLVFEVVASREVCRVAPLGAWSALFPVGAVLTVADGVVAVDGEPAWVPGEKRLPVAWYRPGDVGYLSVFAREESGWTSSP
jgi:tRNA(Ile)-lysidine synthase